MTFFGPHPPPGQEVQCTARIRHLDPIGVRTDMELCVEGRLWAKIEGWEDQRFESDTRVFAVMLFPELNLLGQRRAEGYLVQVHATFFAITCLRCSTYLHVK
jgi:hypothetical protein